jgi:hypothetical protein
MYVSVDILSDTNGTAVTVYMTITLQWPMTGLEVVLMALLANLETLELIARSLVDS